MSFPTMYNQKFKLSLNVANYDLNRNKTKTRHHSI